MLPLILERFESLGHPRVVHLVELLEFIRMFKLDVETYSSGASSLPVTVRALIPLHLNGQWSYSREDVSPN